VVSPADAHSNVGVLLAQQGKVEEARAELQKAIALDPDSKQARVVLDRLESPPPRSVATTESAPTSSSP
jgi:Tfp pilus assembly protein PilF